MTLADGARLGPYQIVSILGAGGMGEVYKAKDLRLDRLVAIKIIRGTFSEDDDRRQRFDQEARAVAQLNHPSVLVLHDFGVHEGAPYMVSEFIEGETLRALIAQGPLSPRRTIDIACEVAQGLAAAHEKDIVHRDLKPENILIPKAGRAKILDFGIAKVAKKQAAADDDAPTARILTEPGHIIGTVGYMSPEQVRGQDADSRSDIFAFGAIVHEMLSGKQSFVRNSAVESLNAILKDDPPELAELGIVAPQGLERAVRRCLEKEPARRFQSAHDLAFALETMDTQPRRADAAPAESPRPKLRLPALLGVAAVAASAFAVGWLWPRKPIPAPRFEFHRLTFQRGIVSGALFAPDGQTIVYDGSFEGIPGGLFTTRAGSHEFRSLDLPHGTQLLALSSTGELAVRLPSSAQGVLARVPLAGGVPRPLVEGASIADWSPDGKDLAIVRNLPGATRLEYPIGTTLAEVIRPGRIGRVRVSPEGDRVAFVEHPPGSNSPGHVTVVDRKGSRRVLSGDWLGMLSVAWSEDGREVYFGGTNRKSVLEGGAGLGPPAIWAVDMTGKERLVLKGFSELTLRDARKGKLLVTESVGPRMELAFRSASETERDLSWLNWSVAADLSRDGTLVLFDETRTGDTTEAVYLRKTDGTPPIRLGNGLALALSADGRWAATVETMSAPAPIVLMPTGAGEARTLKNVGLTYLSARFFPDGKRLLVRANEPGRNPRLYVQGIDDGGLQPVTPEDATGIALSPDGERVATLGADGRAMSYPTKGGDGTPLAGFEPGDQPVQWSADGRSLFAGRLAGQRCDVFRIALGSGKRELFRTFAATNFQSYPLRALVTPDGRSSLIAIRHYWLDLYVVEGAR